MFWVVEEMFNEDSIVVESRFGFGCSFFEGFFEVFGFVDDFYIMVIIFVGSFDNDGEIIFVGKGFDFFVCGDSVFCVRNDGDIGGNGKFLSGNFVIK